MILWRSLGPYHAARCQAANQALQPRGWRTVAIEISDLEESRDWRLDRAASDVEVRTLMPGILLHSSTPPCVTRLLEQLDELRPQAIAVAGYDRPEMREALRWARRHAAAAILMSETKCDDRSRPLWRQWLVSRLVRRADAALVSGAAAGEHLVALGMPRERVFRQYGVVDNAFFAARSARLRGGGLAGHTPYFLACCRMIEARKNLQRLLLAYESYRRLNPQNPWNLVLCGDGPDRAWLAQLALSRGIDGVVWAGFQQVDSLADYYARAGCFIHTAVNEAWGLVINEALAAGLPVLVSRRCGAAYDLVHEGINGHTFDPYNPDEMARLMAEMASLPDARRAAMAAASQAIADRFAPHWFAQGLWSAIQMHPAHREGIK